MRRDVFDDLAVRREGIHHHFFLIVQVGAAQKKCDAAPDQRTTQTSFPEPSVQIRLLQSKEITSIQHGITSIVRNAAVEVSARGSPRSNFDTRLAGPPKFRRIRVLVDYDIFDGPSGRVQLIY